MKFTSTKPGPLIQTKSK